MVSNQLSNVTGLTGSCGGGASGGGGSTSTPLVANSYPWQVTVSLTGGVPLVSITPATVMSTSTGAAGLTSFTNGTPATGTLTCLPSCTPTSPATISSITFAPASGKIPATGANPLVTTFSFTITDGAGHTASSTAPLTLAACTPGSDALGTVCAYNSQTVVSAGTVAGNTPGSIYVWMTDLSEAWSPYSNQVMNFTSPDPHDYTSATLALGDTGGFNETARMVSATYNSPGGAVGSPAAAGCQALDTSKDWYVPAFGELTQLYGSSGANATAINAAASTISGGRSFSSAWYWSASEYYAGSGAWLEDFGSGGSTDFTKSGPHPVRCVRR